LEFTITQKSFTRQFSEAAKQKKIQKIFKVRKQEKKRA